MDTVEEFVIKINHNVAELKGKFEVASRAAEQLGDALDDINNVNLKVWQEEDETTIDEKGVHASGGNLNVERNGCALDVDGLMYKPKFHINDLDDIHAIANNSIRKCPDVESVSKAQVLRVLRAIEKIQ